MLKIRILRTCGDPKGQLRPEFWHVHSSVYAILMQGICSHKCFKFFLKWACNDNMQYIQCKMKSLKTLLANYHHNCINVKICGKLWQKDLFLEKISVKPHFFTSDFLYELSYLYTVSILLMYFHQLLSLLPREISFSLF